MTEVIELARRRPNPAHTVSLDPFQCAFLLHRLDNTDAVTRKLSAGRAQWNPTAVERRLLNIVAVLREDSRLAVYTPLDRALVVEAIQGNTYFLMPSRWNPDHYQKADDLRRDLEVALRCSIGRVPLVDSTPPEAA